MQSNITALILAGGAGSRMGGVDKGLVPYNNQPLIASVINKLAGSCNQLLISCNRNLEIYQDFGYPIICDKQQTDDINYEGPLAGILAALPKIQTEYLLISPCDTPQLPSNLAERLYQTLKTSPESHIAVAHDGTRRQNLHCMMHSSLFDSLALFYHRGGRALKLWYSQQSTIDVDFSAEAESFANINSLDFPRNHHQVNED